MGLSGAEWGFGEGHSASQEGGLGSSFGAEREAVGALIPIMRAVWCDWG